VPEPDRLGAADTAAVAWASEMPPERSALEAEAKPLPSHRTEIGGGGGAGRGRRRDAQRWTALGGVTAAAAGKRRNGGGGAEEKKEPGMNLPMPRGINRLSRKCA
jgi:hypothetical protein